MDSGLSHVPSIGLAGRLCLRGQALQLRLSMAGVRVNEETRVDGSSVESITASLPDIESGTRMNRLDYLCLGSLMLLAAMPYWGMAILLGLLWLFMGLGAFETAFDRAAIASIAAVIVIDLAWLAFIMIPWTKQSNRDSRRMKSLLDAVRGLPPQERAELVGICERDYPRLAYILTHSGPFRRELAPT